MKKIFGTDRKGNTVTAYTIAKGKLSATILDRGATIQSLVYDGVDVCLGYDTVEAYEQNEGYLGATIGRYGNRIAEGKFHLNGKTFDVGRNEKEKHHLHGGEIGYDKLMWTVTEHTADALTLTLTDRGEQSGYPGTVEVGVRFSVVEDALLLEYSALADEDTPFNPTNHCYFNLNGVGVGDVLEHKLQLFATRYLPVDAGLIPTGVFRPVADTAFDFVTAPKAIGRDIRAEDRQLFLGGGYDHNFCIDGEGFRPHAQVYSAQSGIYMTVFSDQPGVQLYTGNVLETMVGKGTETGYGHYGALCLETQHYPDSPNHPQFPCTVLKAGERYESKTAYGFTKGE